MCVCAPLLSIAMQLVIFLVYIVTFPSSQLSALPPQCKIEVTSSGWQADPKNDYTEAWLHVRNNDEVPCKVFIIFIGNFENKSDTRVMDPKTTVFFSIRLFKPPGLSDIAPDFLVHSEKISVTVGLVPVFPWEAVVIGIALGLLALLMLRRRWSAVTHSN